MLSIFSEEYFSLTFSIGDIIIFFSFFLCFFLCFFVSFFLYFFLSFFVSFFLCFFLSFSLSFFLSFFYLFYFLFFSFKLFYNNKMRTSAELRKILKANEIKEYSTTLNQNMNWKQIRLMFILPYTKLLRPWIKILE